MHKHEFNKNELEAVSDIMTEYTEQETDSRKQKEAYEGYLQLDTRKANELCDVEQTSSTNENYDSISDDELEYLYEQILESDDSERTEEQSDLLEHTKERYLKIKFYREFEDAATWFETEYPEKKFKDIITSDEFLGFAAGIKLPVRELVRRYMNMNEKYEKQQFVSSGSVKTSGATVGKDYFSPAEVNRMTEDEVVKNLDIIKKSMTKWK